MSAPQTPTISPPTISVITVTLNRRELLLKKLESLKQQTLEPSRFEFVVFVNGSTDGTLEALQQAPLPFATTVLASDRTVSIGEARNACARAARAALLYLSDDDCLLLPETLAGHGRAHQGEAPFVAVAGVRWESAAGTELMEPPRVNYWNLHGVNTSLPKAAFWDAGGFDEGLVGYGLEDVLFGYHLHQQGYAFRALPGLAVRHLGANPVRLPDTAKARSAGRNARRIVRRYPELAFRLGVHGGLLALKRAVFALPVGTLWRSLDSASYEYERAYLAGALEEGHGGE